MRVLIPPTGEYPGTDFPGESVLALSCDKSCQVLVTADTQGFIYTWDIAEFCIRPQDEVSSFELGSSIYKTLWWEERRFSAY